MSATRELLVKVKLVSDNTNPGASPVIGLGGSPVASGSGKSPTGNQNPTSTASASAVDKALAHEKAMDRLRAAAGGAADGLHGFSGALGKTVAALALIQAYAGKSSAVGSIAGSVSNFIKGPLAVGMAAGAAASAPVLGADHVMSNYNKSADGWLGHGKPWLSESGEHQFGSFNRYMEQNVGGGKTDSRGIWRSQEHQMGVIDHQAQDRIRRNAMQSPFDLIKMEGRQTQYAMSDQLHDIKMQGASFKGYGSVALKAEKEHRAMFDDNIASSKNVYEQVYGKTIGGLMAQNESHGADLQSQVYGSQAADVHREKKLSKDAGTALEWQLARAHTNYNNAADSRDSDMKAVNFKTDSMKEEAKEILRINEAIRQNKMQQADLDKKMADLTTKALVGKKADTDAKLATARSIVMTSMQTLENSKLNYGLMDEGDQQYEKDKADRFKGGGLKALTQEERQSMLNGPLGEDIRRQAIEKAENDPNFAGMVRGSRIESNLNLAQGQMTNLGNLSANIKNEINAKVELDGLSLAKTFAESLLPLVAKVTVEAQRLMDIRLEQGNNQAAMRRGAERAPNE